MYRHIVQYYETDKMGITHHSNYIRWMEESRVDFLEKSNCSYRYLEEIGLISPVLSVNCEYKESTTFGDVIEVDVKIIEYNGVKLKIKYTMKNVATNNIVLIATSEHCFLDSQKRIIILKRTHPEIHEKLKDLL